MSDAAIPAKRQVRIPRKLLMIVGGGVLALSGVVTGAVLMLGPVIGPYACAQAGVFCPPDIMEIKNMTTAELRVTDPQDSIRVSLNGRLVEIADRGGKERWIPILSLLKPGDNTLLVQIDGKPGICGGGVSLRINDQEVPELAHAWAVPLPPGRSGNCVTQMITLPFK